MVTVNRVHMLIATGNTYGNLPLLKRVGFQFFNGERSWKLNVERHPMNNTKQKKKLEAMLTELEEGGVRFIVYLTDGAIKQ